MEYTCFEGMTLPFLLDERRSTMNGNTVSSSASTHLLESFHAHQHQQPQLNQSYNFYNPQLCNFPAVSWSTTDPTLLLTDQQQQQDRPEFLFSTGGNVKVSFDSSRDENMEIEASCCGLSSFPTVQQLFHNRRSGDLHHHAGGLNSSVAAVTAQQINLHGDMTTMSGTGNRRDNALSSSSSASSIDPFSFCVGGGGGSRAINAAPSQSQWMQQMCSLSSDQYYSSVDDLMPKLVSDPFTDSPQQQQQPCSYHTSSTSVNCLNEADSCGSSERDRSTTSEEINWMNTSSCNNSDLRNLPNLHGYVGSDSVTGLIMSSSVPMELSDELSSPIAAAADEVELATTPTIVDHVQHHQRHHHRSACGSTNTSVALGAAAAAAPSGRGSWMSPGIGSVQKNNHLRTAATLDPLLLLGSGAAATSPTQEQLQFSKGLLTSPRSALGPFKPLQQHRAYTLDVLPTRTPSFSFSASQNCSSGISPRYSSVYSMPPAVINPGLVDNCTGSGSSFYKDFHGFSSRPQQHHGGGVAASSSGGQTSVGGGVGVTEFNVGGGTYESRKDYCSDQMTLLSASRKPNATSIEPQSVAARHRRKKISERVRILEKLIPGGSKMDTASMLDEAIDYVKFLQLQVQLLESMGEPETATAGGRSSFKEAATTSTTTTTINSSAFHPHDNSKVDSCSSALTGGGFGSSSHHLIVSSALMEQVTIASATTTTTAPKSPSSPPLILSEVLQEQLFKQKLCLVSLRQYCPQGRRSTGGSINWAETNKDRAV